MSNVKKLTKQVAEQFLANEDSVDLRTCFEIQF